MHGLLHQLNAQLVHQGVLVQQGGGIIDASIALTSRKPQGKSTYTLSDQPAPPPIKGVKPGVDQEAQWMKQGGKLQYGCKRHYQAAEGTGFALAVHTTAANVHDGQCMASCLDQVVTACRKSRPSRQRVLLSQERVALTSKGGTQWYSTQGLQQ